MVDSALRVRWPDRGGLRCGGHRCRSPYQAPKQESTTTKGTPKTKADSRNVQIGVGEVAELSDRTLVVNEVQRNYPPPRYSRVQPGNELTRVYITLKNTGNRSFDHNLNNFKVQNSNGVQKTPQVITELPNRIEYGSLASGGTLEGNMVFEVPQGDSNLSLIYEPYEHMSTATVTVALQ